MTPADRERVKELLEQAARLEPARRRSFIESTAENREIASELLELLHTLDDPLFMHAPTGAGFELAGANMPLEGPGSSIGRYKLLQLIGEGGFGAVYMAEQDEPVRRRVALKIIKAGMDTRQVIARFEAERQALAMMDHPNIARVFDAGTTDAGRPFFVMELVRGQRVTTYCDGQRLSVSERLELFRSVCHAVQHAHQKGIIHRDLKPSNVLVTVADGRPVPKVIDFGIAKATQTRLTDKTLFTEMHQLIGTPEYMSPEQAEVSGVDIDTRSDVYSLGVMLYELLAGSTPLDHERLRATPLPEIQRLIREEDPPRPSLRFATLASSHEAAARTPLQVNRDSGTSAIDIARSRQVDPANLTRALRGDLDWIVMKCLEKDRSRRYATANALAEDLGRFLQHHPVLATPPSRAYRIRKFVERNRSLVFAGSAIALVLVLGIIGTTLGLVRAVREQNRTQQQRLIAEQNANRANAAAERADREAAQTRAVAEFQAAMLADIDPQSMGLKLRSELLEKTREAAKQSGLSLDETEKRLAALQNLIAGVDFTGMGVASLDTNLFQNAIDAIDEKFGGQPLIRAQLLTTLAGVQRELGLYESASRPQELALAIRREQLGDDHVDTLTSLCNLGELRLAQGKLEEAEALIRQSVNGLRETVGDDHKLTLGCLNNLGHANMELGKLADAEALFREALPTMRRVLGNEAPETLSVISNLSQLLQEQSRFDEAAPFLFEALETRRRVFGEDHPDTLISIHQMGIFLIAQGKADEAEVYCRESLEKHRRIFGNDYPRTLTALMTMGFVLRSQGRLSEVEPYYLEALQKDRILLGDRHPNTITTINNLGFLLQAQGKYTQAEPYCREAMDSWRELLGDDHADTLLAVNNMGNVLLAQGRLEEAEPYCRNAVEGRRRVRGELHSDTLISITNLGILLQAQGKSAEAVDLLAPVEEAVRQSFTAANVVRVGRFLTPLGRARVSLGELDLAESILTEANEILSEAKNATARDRTEVVTGLIELYDARHAAAPDQGHEASAAQWRATLSDLQSQK